jgi:hypothetical protein
LATFTDGATFNTPFADEILHAKKEEALTNTIPILST